MNITTCAGDDEGRYRILAHDDNGTLMGYLVFREKSPDEAHVLDMRTLPAFRRQGVNQALVEAFIATGHKFMSTTPMSPLGRKAWAGVKAKHPELTHDPRRVRS